VFYEEKLLYADSHFFDIFSFSLIKGDPKTALESPNAMVITQAMAKHYFGNEDPMGKTLQLSTRAHKQKTMQITGIVDDIPDHSHFTFRGLLSNQGNSDRDKEYSGAYTYLLLSQTANIQHLTNQLGEWLPQQFPRNKESGYTTTISTTVKTSQKPESLTPTKPHSPKPFTLYALTDIHLYSNLQGELGTNRDIRELYLFCAVGILILVIACINYMNLATARSANRAREVGLRKVIGANRKQLIHQFLGESILLTAIAFILAIALTEVFLPILNVSVGRTLTLHYDHQFFTIISITALFIGTVSGSYPAFYLSRFRPIAILRGHATTTSKRAGFRKSLVVFQFAISIGLISATGVVMWQMQFMKTKALGMDTQNSIILDTEGIDRTGGLKYKRGVVATRFQTIKDELQRNPNILNISLASNMPGQTFFAGGNYKLDNNSDTPAKRIKTLFVDQNYVEMLNLTFIAGQNFTSTFTKEYQTTLILNESAAREMSLDTAAIGQLVTIPGLLNETGIIVGFVKDFHIRSLHHKIEPLVLRLHYDPDFAWHASHLVVKFHPGTLPQTLSYLKAQWAKLAPNHPFTYTSLDTYWDFDQLYQQETRLMRIFGAFSMLAIFVAFLGLVGLASFTAESRTKEIGIRKVFGASVTNIITLLSKDFVKLIVIANLIAWPTAYYVAHNWLQNFAYRITLGWGIFALSGILALCLALITVGWQATKTAQANPVDTLRVE